MLCTVCQQRREENSANLGQDLRVCVISLRGKFNRANLMKYIKILVLDCMPTFLYRYMLDKNQKIQVSVSIFVVYGEHEPHCNQNLDM